MERPDTHPYDFQKVNTKMFFGRDAQSRAILQGIERMASFAVCGGRRMGKTTLLKYIEERRKSARDVAYIDIKRKLVSLSAPEDLLRQILRATVSISSGEARVSATTTETSLDGFETDMLSAVASLPNGSLALLLDEADALLNRPWGKDFFSFMRSLISNSSLSKRVAVVLTGGRNLRQLARLGGSPFNVATWDYLRPFSDQDTSRLMTEPMQLAISEDVLESAFRFTGGHPYIIQFIMSELLSSLPDVSMDSLNQAENSFLSTQAFQMRSWWQELTDDDRTLYAFLLQSGAEVDFGECSEALGHVAEESIEGLVAYGLATISGDQNHCTGTCDAFRQWFVKNSPKILKESPNASGNIFTPQNSFSNVVILRRLLSEIEGYIWWVDPHFGFRALEEILLAADPPRLREIRILSRTDMFTEKARKEFKRFQSEMLNKGISSEWRLMSKEFVQREKVHDRYLIGANVVYNLPPVNSIFEGAYGEALKTTNRPPFERWWEECTADA